MKMEDMPDSLLMNILAVFGSSCGGFIIGLAISEAINIGLI